MSYINAIPVQEATGAVHSMYERQQQSWGYVPDYAKVFSLRPEVMARWGMLLAEIKRPVDERLFELVTLAAALELRNSSCALAHGCRLAKIIGRDAVIAIARREHHEALSESDRSVLQFARRLARDASQIRSADVAELKQTHGFSDEQIFDIVAIAAGRAFFTKLLDGLGSEPDANFATQDHDLCEALAVGKPISISKTDTLA